MTMTTATESIQCKSSWRRTVYSLPHPPYFPDLVPCDFFYFTKVEIGAEEAGFGEFGRNKIENGRLPVEHSQI